MRYKEWLKSKLEELEQGNAPEYLLAALRDVYREKAKKTHVRAYRDIAHELDNIVHHVILHLPGHTGSPFEPSWPMHEMERNE
jgi:hypothetical protein